MRLLLASAVVLISPLACAAQASPAFRSDLFAGASFNGSNPSSNTTVGVNGGADFRIVGPLGIEGQVGWFSAGNGAANTTMIVDYLFGPRVQTRVSSRVAPLADFLIGGQTLNNSSSQHTYYYTSGSGFAAAGDVGADIRLTHRIALRGQVGFIFSNFAVSGGGGPVGNYRWRAGTNLIYRF